MTSTASPGHGGDDQKVAALLQALEKLPPHRGVSYRGFPSDHAFGVREGQVLVTNLLTATSRDVRIATENFTSHGLFVVVGRTGRAIEQLSRHPDEQEVVFLPVSMFMVIRTARVDDLPVAIVEQLNPELGKPDDALATLDELGTLAATRVRQGQQAPPVTIHSPGKFSGDIE